MGGGVVGLLLVDLALDHVEFCKFGEFEDGVEESGGEFDSVAVRIRGIHPDLKKE